MEARACALGLMAACEREADDLAPGDAIPLYRRACEAARPSPHACLNLARAYEAVSEPRTVVRASYRRACEQLSFDACAWIATQGAGLDIESGPLVEAFRRWCDSGDARACGLVAGATARAP